MRCFRNPGMSKVAAVVFKANTRYFRQRVGIDLANAELHKLRFKTCETMARVMIDGVRDENFLFTQILLRR
jgi:hypothetical protein